MKTSNTKQLVSKLLISLFFLFSASNLLAHAKSETSDPAARSVLSHSPEAIKIVFSEQLEPAYSTIIVKGKDSKSVTEEKATVDPDNNKRLLLKLPNLSAGKYTVYYKVLSVDGHVVKSKYSFRIKEVSH